MSKWYLLEILLLLICPIPHYETYISIKYSIKESADIKRPMEITIHQFLSDYILVFMFLRIYFIFKCLFNYSMYSDDFSKRLCKSHGFYPGFRFVVKS